MNNLELTQKLSGGRAEYRCSCGNIFTAYIGNVSSGSVKSCGCVNRRLKHKLTNLLNDSLESYYWLGFLLADAHFTRMGRLCLTLANKDKEHLEALNKFLGYPAKIRLGEKYCSFAVNDKYTVEKLMSKYLIEENKTINPPKFLELDDERKTAVLVGFIDGDGNIQPQYSRKDYRITIKLHSTWVHWLSDIAGKTAYINNKGYAVTCIANTERVQALKMFCIKHNLPILNRKWDGIDTNYLSRSVIASKNKEAVLILLNEGKSVKEISEQTGLKYTTVYNIIIRRSNLK